MRRLVIGILAHVDAGKTTLSEALLYTSGALTRLGRVDKGDAYLDTHTIERERGITVFSKQAMFTYGDTEYTLIDTPGHIDFIAEAERAVTVQDAAILVISATDGVTSHTKTLWNLLASRGVPTFIFVNKTDISERRRSMIMDELSGLLSVGCVDFSVEHGDEFFESVASADEELMEEYFSCGTLSDESITRAVGRRSVIPCAFGSALKMRGVEELLRLIERYSPTPARPTDFGARVYKISRDPQGKRLVYLKLEGGSLRTKTAVAHKDKSGSEVMEKVEELRLYSGDKFKSVSEVFSGQVAAVLGLSSAFVSEGLGFCKSDGVTHSPVLDYRVVLPEGTNPYEAYLKLSHLSEEDPTLALSFDPRLREVRIRLMGQIQTEVIKRIIFDRFGISVDFDGGKILYKETVTSGAIGSGHFEPLRHYAEAHIRIDPLPRGEGVVVGSECDTDSLALNWQRLIITHLEEKMHRGVLTGSPITDVKLTLVAGRAHLKHTEGGDFRQATYRAVRQGLYKSRSLLLEPTFDFTLEVPTACLGRAMTDITNMHGSCEPPTFTETGAILVGNAPVSTMRYYANDLRAYTGGEGKLSLSVGEYAPCHNADEVIAEIGYDPDLDERNTASSVFCKGGAGYAVPWNEADKLMHIKLGGGSDRSGECEGAEREDTRIRETRTAGARDYAESKMLDEELLRIFERTFGKIKPRRVIERVVNEAPKEKKQRTTRPAAKRGEMIVIDGYNFIFAIEPLRKISEGDIALARDILVRIMCDFTAYKSTHATIVFDGYKREGGGSSEELERVSVVYTKEKQTADSYIEKMTHDIAADHTVRVVTGDMQEQFVVLGAGGLRVSPREFFAEIEDSVSEIRESIYLNNNNIKSPSKSDK